MTDDDAPLDLGERIRRIVGTIAGEVDRRWAAGGESSPLLDAAARSLAATIEGWGRNPSLRRFLGAVERDVLTGSGERVELSASLGVAARLGHLARFYVDDVAIGMVPIGDDGEARLLIDAPEPGLHRE